MKNAMRILLTALPSFFVCFPAYAEPSMNSVVHIRLGQQNPSAEYTMGQLYNWLELSGNKCQWVELDDYEYILECLREDVMLEKTFSSKLLILQHPQQEMAIITRMVTEGEEASPNTIVHLFITQWGEAIRAQPQ